ncbi:MAG: serine hydrolase [Candidatus Aminicenantaceae bacterium]
MYNNVNLKTRWAGLIILALLLFSFSSTDCRPKPSNISDEVKENIRQRIDNGLAVGIVVGFIDDRGNREYFSSGTAALSSENQVDEDSVYEIGSISKVFTGLLFADMVLKGEIKLDDLVEAHLPQAVTVPSRNGAKITLEHLATHTSALARMPTNFIPANKYDPYADYLVEDLYEFISGYTLTRDIGEKYEYSNLGMGLLGHILSLNAGMGYEQLMTERICEVLGLESTVLTFTEELQERLARGHNSAGEVPNWDIPTLAGAGAIRSTARDMLTFLGANMGQERTALSEAMDMTHKARVEAGKDMHVGLAWHIRDNGQTRIVWHNGGTGGYRTFCGFIKEQKIGVVVLSNMNLGVDDIGFHVLDSSYELQTIKEEVKVGADILDRYAGQYKFEKDDTVIAVSRKGSRLVTEFPGQVPLAFFPESETKFFMKEAPITITFNVDEAGVVTGLVLHQSGRDSGAAKID